MEVVTTTSFIHNFLYQTAPVMLWEDFECYRVLVGLGLKNTKTYSTILPNKLISLCIVLLYCSLPLSPLLAEFLVSEDGGQNIVISDAFIKGRNSALPY